MLRLNSRESSIDNIDVLNISLPSSSRPLSSRLSRYAALPQIGTKIAQPSAQNSEASSTLAKSSSVSNLNDSDQILIGLRLPNGKKTQKTFSIKSKIDSVLEFAINELKKDNKLILKSNFTLSPSLKFSSDTVDSNILSNELPLSYVIELKALPMSALVMTWLETG